MIPNDDATTTAIRNQADDDDGAGDGDVNGDDGGDRNAGRNRRVPSGHSINRGHHGSARHDDDDDDNNVAPCLRLLVGNFRWSATTTVWKLSCAQGCWLPTGHSTA